MRTDRPPTGGSLYGKIKRIWEVARSSKKIAYGVYRSENRARTAVPGPLNPTLIIPYKAALVKCFMKKKTRFSPRLFSGSSIRNYHNNCKMRPCRLCLGQHCCRFHNLNILHCRCSHHPRPTSPQSHHTHAEGLPKYTRKEWENWSSGGNPSH